MSLHYLKSLLFRSAKIQEEIEREQGYRWPDWLRLLKLKKIRLLIRDRMEKMVRQGAFGLNMTDLRVARIRVERPRHGRDR